MSDLIPYVYGPGGVLVRAGRGLALGGGGGGGLLTWAPPSGWEAYTEQAVPTAGGVVTLDDGTDYVLTQSAPVERCVTIKGGRNIVWIGGESLIDDFFSFNENDQASVRFYKSDSWTSGNQLNNGRIIHLEGFLAHGYYASSDIQFNCPEADVRIQNCRAEAGMWGRNSGAGDSINTPHPDALQGWGGVGWLRVDRFTGLCTYQGLMLKPDFNGPNQGPMQLKNLNLRAQDAAAGVVEITDPNPPDTDPLPSGREWPNYLWWTNGDEGGVRVEKGTVWINHPNRTFAGKKVFWPDDELHVVDTDDTGTYANPAHSSGWDGTGDAFVYEGNPPGGDYVSKAALGLGTYQSPGYQ